jgi:hypothetical protein
MAGAVRCAKRRTDKCKCRSASDGPGSVATKASLLAFVTSGTPRTPQMRSAILALALVASLPAALSFLDTSPIVAWSSHR